MRISLLENMKSLLRRRKLIFSSKEKQIKKGHYLFIFVEVYIKYVYEGIIVKQQSDVFFLFGEYMSHHLSMNYDRNHVIISSIILKKKDFFSCQKNLVPSRNE